MYEDFSFNLYTSSGLAAKQRKMPIFPVLCHLLALGHGQTRYYVVDGIGQIQIHGMRTASNLRHALSPSSALLKHFRRAL